MQLIKLVPYSFTFLSHIMLSFNRMTDLSQCISTVYVDALLHFVVYIFQDKRTPLHYAAFNGMTEVATLLINSGANLNAVDKVSTIQFYFFITYNIIIYTKL